MCWADWSEMNKKLKTLDCSNAIEILAKHFHQLHIIYSSQLRKSQKEESATIKGKTKHKWKYRKSCQAFSFIFKAVYISIKF